MVQPQRLVLDASDDLPGPLMFCLYYGLLVLACSGWLARPRARWIGAGSAFALMVLSIIKGYEQRQWHRVTLLPLNGSHTVYVEPAFGGQEWLINCGDRGAVEFSVKPFLQSKGTDRIPHLLLTHGDARYVSGALLLNELFPVERTYASPIIFRSPRYRDVLAQLKKSSGLELCMTNGFISPPWTILHPNSSDRFASAKDNGVVASATFGGVRVLIVPPLGRAAQKAIFTRHPNLGADILIADWPEDAGLAPEWIESIYPKLLLIGGLSSSTRHQWTIARRFNQICPTLLVQNQTGAVTISLRNAKWQMEARTLNELEPIPETGAPGVRGE
jgi:competence protein ComEC